MEDVRKTKKEKIEKDNLYKLYKAGMVEIKQPEIINIKFFQLNIF